MPNPYQTNNISNDGNAEVQPQSLDNANDASQTLSNSAFDLMKENNSSTGFDKVGPTNTSQENFLNDLEIVGLDQGKSNAASSDNTMQKQGVEMNGQADNGISLTSEEGFSNQMVAGMEASKDNQDQQNPEPPDKNTADALKEAAANIGQDTAGHSNTAESDLVNKLIDGTNNSQDKQNPEKPGKDNDKENSLKPGNKETDKDSEKHQSGGSDSETDEKIPPAPEAPNDNPQNDEIPTAPEAEEDNLADDEVPIDPEQDEVPTDPDQKPNESDSKKNKAPVKDQPTTSPNIGDSSQPLPYGMAATQMNTTDRGGDQAKPGENSGLRGEGTDNYPATQPAGTQGDWGMGNQTTSDASGDPPLFDRGAQSSREFANINAAAHAVGQDVSGHSSTSMSDLANKMAAGAANRAMEQSGKPKTTGAQRSN